MRGHGYRQKNRPGVRVQIPPKQPRPSWGTVRALREAVEKRDGRTCRYCGIEGALTLDHIVPLARGGDAVDLSNLQLLCKPCNHAKDSGPDLLGRRKA